MGVIGAAAQAEKMACAATPTKCHVGKNVHFAQVGRRQKMLFNEQAIAAADPIFQFWRAITRSARASRLCDTYCSLCSCGGWSPT